MRHPHLRCHDTWQSRGRSRRVSNLSDVNNILDAFQSRGCDEIDTARIYGGGSAEETHGHQLYPQKGKNMPVDTTIYSDHPGNVRRDHFDSLKVLNTSNLDRTMPFDALREVSILYKGGYFNIFRIRNYILRDQPSASSASATASGFLTSRYQRDIKEDEYESGSRFDPKRWQGKLDQGRYLNSFRTGVLDICRPVTRKHGLTKAKFTAISAKSAKQLEQNLGDLEKVPALDGILEAPGAAWFHVKGIVLKYFH
ncbi:uncharacterized protein BDR25DRAFT_328906 [Lindgomyces ingoldianus]|uniref:Uncharacterized protein n=1 Tax=Lindgomyces ingoldianus TaxID=673940 RepID=A0ACB6QDZ4_9PLEO|nr:uncharacterized protein BDR25DRAFT_328906 [Lindgomyces ingoldianus]KAF2465116.1 hypothetical protein BDR25DRAFT_328906 [Lindgomyces ingoldianus]